jgi:flagellar M-ring protein FliF
MDKQVKRLLSMVTVRQRWSLAAAAILIVAAVYSFTRWQHDSGFSPLYTALAQDDAGPIVQKLKEEGVEYRISADGASISVPRERAPELRLQMAAAGYPKSGRIGFEIFDKANFGVTDFAEHVNYRRALEGELERSVIALSQVEQARVHISFPQESIFTESRQPAKASVLIKLRPGAQLPESAIPAITHLVSSAVEGLAPEAVSVLDMRGNLLNRGKRTGDKNQDLSEGALEYKHRVEQDLTAKLNSTLEPVVGLGRFRAAVSADCDITSGEQSEENLDPTHSVMVTSQKTEDVSSPTTHAAAGGVPGTASNLPDPAPRPATTGGGVSRRTESVNYQTSRTVKHTVLPQGALKRLSVSILIDQEVHFEGSGPKAKRVLVPPSPERLKVIHDLASAAVGMDAGRGDQLIVESLPFESTLNLDPIDTFAPLTKAPPPGVIEMVKTNPKSVVGISTALLALFGAAGFMFIRWRKKHAKASMQVHHEAALLMPGEGVSTRLEEAADTWHPSSTASTAIGALRAPQSDVLANQLREVLAKDAEICVGVLRGWLQQEHGNS